MQTQTLSRRVREAEQIGSLVLDVVTAAGLPERTFDPLFDAALGLRVRRPTYVKRSGVEERTATRDLKALVDAGLLVAEGNTRGRIYRAAGAVAEVHRELRSRREQLVDPYPGFRDQLIRASTRP